MTFNAHRLRNTGEPEDFAPRFTSPPKHNTTLAWEARSLDDFRQATRMMMRASRTGICPIDPTRIGRLLSMLNHKGSGPKTGCVILAGETDRTAGFALLLVRPDACLELSWIHADDPDCECRVVEKLWDQAVRKQCEWGFKTLHVGYCVSLPNTTSQRMRR